MAGSIGLNLSSTAKQVVEISEVYESSESKVLTGAGYSEYFRCLFDWTGYVWRCVNRSIAVMAIGSFQNAQ